MNYKEIKNLTDLKSFLNEQSLVKTGVVTWNWKYGNPDSSSLLRTPEGIDYQIEHRTKDEMSLYFIEEVVNKEEVGRPELEFIIRCGIYNHTDKSIKIKE